MIKRLALLTGLSCLLAACADDKDPGNVQADVVAALREATVESKQISSGELTATLDTYDNEPGEHPFADNLGLTGGTSATIWRNDEPLIVVMPENGSYSIAVFNPNNKEEMLAHLDIDANTGLLTRISYFGRSNDGDWFDVTDGNVDGQPETIIVSQGEGLSRIWVRNSWRPLVKQDGITGVILDGQWRGVSRDPQTKQWDLVDTPGPSGE